MRHCPRGSLASVLAFCLVLAASPAFGQTKVKPGFNIFNEKQDVEIGQQSAQEVEKQLPILKDSAVQDYVSRIGERLAQSAPGPKFPYQFKVVNVSDINAFALPGGFMFINRGLIEAAHDEAELAGVMAHEMSHVALRHGTNQASKAYLAQAGLSILGGAAGGSTGDIIGAVGGFGANSLFLKFSRTAEEQADVVGAQILAKSGYDPLAMARMFETLREKAGRDPGKLEQFFSSHPAPADRARRIEDEARLIGGYDRRSAVGNFASIQSRLERMPPAPSMEKLAGAKPGSGGGSDTGSGQPVRVDIETPSSRMKSFEPKNGAFRIRYPDNWNASESDNQNGVTIAPRNGVVSQGNEEAIVYGVIVNTSAPEASTRSTSSGSQLTLDQATDQLVKQIVQGNEYLRPVTGSERRETIDGSRGKSLVLSGRSPVTGEDEQVTLASVFLQDGRLLYALFIAPRRAIPQMGPLFRDMMSSLRLEQ